jgi:hypothetical protein
MGISLFWSFGCANALLAVMTHGGTLVLQESLDPAGALALFERERCTVYYGTPNIALALTEHPDRARRDLRSLRTGAAIGSPPAMQMVMDLGAREICNVYGLTETYGNCSVTDAHDPAEVRLHTVGYPLPGMELRIVDRETGRPLPPGEIGEVLVRGHLTPGYYKDPARNAEAFDAGLVTGDLGLATTGGSGSAGMRWSRPGSTSRPSRWKGPARPPRSRRHRRAADSARGDPRRRHRPPGRPDAEPEALQAFCERAPRSGPGIPVPAGRASRHRHRKVQVPPA